MTQTPHTFHIPVMGTGFTQDTPIRLAHFGISSVMSMGDDLLMERLREHYCGKFGMPFEAVPRNHEDARAERVRLWLDFVCDLVERNCAELKTQAFAPGTGIMRYFELLPEGELKAIWRAAMALPQGEKRQKAEARLRELAVPGALDVNIMTKVDRWLKRNGDPLPPDHSDTVAGIRGFAKSRIESSVVFSAGMNPRTYGYLGTVPEFLPDSEGKLRKKVTMKVSDFRSADIQGRYLAKKGVWVSEFRVESGLNCGGHAFAPQGQLLGPIMEEFVSRRDKLRQDLFTLWKKALPGRGAAVPAEAPTQLLSVQGGVGTAEEHQLLIRRYGADSVGWGTPFLLVPEATLVDDEHLEKLRVATRNDIELSYNSPMGIPFWSLKTSSSEERRLERIAAGKPGSPCPHSYLIFNQEFGERAICRSSSEYQSKKLAALDAAGLSPERLAAEKEIVVSRACICLDLSGSILNKLGLEKKADVSICPGPNLTWFNRISSLREMVDHIYGRGTVMAKELAEKRPHQFIAELELTLEHLAKELHESALGLVNRSEAYFEEYRENLRKGVEYYIERSEELFGMSKAKFEELLSNLNHGSMVLSPAV